MSRRISHGKTEDAYNGFTPLLRKIIEDRKCSAVADIGGGAEPQFTPEEIARRGLEYWLIDISADELALAPGQYRRRVMDVAAPQKELEPKFDLAFSRFVLEHVNDAEVAHRNVFAMLNRGGIAVHLFPTLYALPFLVNKLLPESLTVRMLSKKRQERGKFPAHYRWCRGPSTSAVRRLESIGYEVIEYAGFYGHGYYDSIPSLARLQVRWRDFLMARRISFATSFAWVILRKPA